MLRHEITPNAGTKSHGHKQLAADVDEVDCSSRGRGRCWGCRTGAGGQSRSEGSGKGSTAEIWCRFPFEKMENKCKSICWRQGGSELVWREKKSRAVVLFLKTARGSLERDEVSGDDAR